MALKGGGAYECKYRIQRKGAFLLMDVAMLVIAACGFLISLLTFIVLLIEKIAKK